jgi:hypothetical protein
VRVLRSPPILGGLLGTTVALLFAAVVTAIAGSETEFWWWPAVAVFCAIGGGVLGSVLGVEASGESPDEDYHGA